MTGECHRLFYCKHMLFSWKHAGFEGNGKTILMKPVVFYYKHFIDLNQ